ncbi:hypothetical protein CYLTODRAFT_492360 [Cylindrobasidium torrendii FP15055 ss-10]|uniref:L domain-like protein n=1 Tax=Cylindrobasidium torrendii FP15055 ss-10 TaxID=1314674 RepID=A0A0D7B592_9AGAR|nr:hypothetical protein CYLTODRAFT_492360 [Cylindrobasidium torrendii FP15055 ss-10]
MPFHQPHERSDVMASPSTMMATGKPTPSLYSSSWSKSAAYPPVPLTHAAIEAALGNSNDGGATMVLMKHELTDIGSAAAEELATIGSRALEGEQQVERLALGANHLSTLPNQFAMLSRLRYLTLKGNHFTTFPDVLTRMPALDTLDISHNKIRSLPNQPGDLINLRVFCLSRNKLARLPEYLPQFRQLAVLEVDRNPIEWPPAMIMERPAKFATPDQMHDWVRALQSWIQTEGEHDESAFVNVSKVSSTPSREGSFSPWSRLPSDAEFDEGVTPHARSFSIDSNLSASSSVADSDLETPSSSYGELSRPPPLHLGILSTDSAESSPTRSFENMLPSPADSEFSLGEPTAHPSPASLVQSQMHGRNDSYASDAAPQMRPLNLPGKKSMPDLRTARFPFATPRKIAELPPSRPKIMEEPSVASSSSPSTSRKDSSSSASSGFQQARPAPRHRLKPSVQIEPLANQEPNGHIAYERNSYFRRISTLPASSISATMPKPLLALIDCARSILFAVSQIYQTLEHYTVFAIDERLSSVLRKVLDPANSDMMQLISCLDRFDTISRKTVPSRSICRAVVKSCRNAVAVFGKAVSVLSLQLKVIANADDIRYVRSLILVLYGAAAEISWAWQAMAPHLDALKPLLRARPHGASPMASEHYYSSTPSSATQSPAQSSYSLPSVRLRNGGGGVRIERRHAGSFSMKDVEIGKSLPSYDDVPMPQLSRSLMNTATLRAKRKGSSALAPVSVTVSSPSPTSPGPRMSPSDVSSHARTDSLASSLSPDSSTSSPTIPTARAPMLDSTSSKSQVDKEALQAVQNAVTVAPAVWALMEDVLGDVLDARGEMRECLSRARVVTRRLGELVRAMKDTHGDSATDKGMLREDAHSFLKCVVQLSNIVKTYNGSRSSALRNNMYKLTNSTEEFAILLHVSSFAPPASSMSRSTPTLPMSAGSGNGSRNASEEKLSGLGLSRTQSAHGVTNAKTRSATPDRNGPRSAHPTMQTFKLPTMRRYRGRAEDSG